MPLPWISNEDDFEIIYHGTSSNRAGKIVGSEFFEIQGFRLPPVFFAEERPTARYFAFEQIAKYKLPEQTPPLSLTIIEFKIPKNLAVRLKIDRANRRAIGEEMNLPFILVEGGSGFERILYDVNAFNNALTLGQINTRRIRIRV